MVKKGFALVLVVVGLLTFFLPLVRIQAPIVGTQRISGWDVVKPGEQAKTRRPDLGLEETLERIQGNLLQRQHQEVPLAVTQARALIVTLPLAYLALLLGAVFVGLEKWRPFQATVAVGLLAGVYSLISVFWLSSGIREMVAGASRGPRIPLLGQLLKSAAANVEVSPELGLYLLAAALAALLLAGFLPGERH